MSHGHDGHSRWPASVGHLKGKHNCAGSVLAPFDHSLLGLLCPEISVGDNEARLWVRKDCHRRTHDLSRYFSSSSALR